MGKLVLYVVDTETTNLSPDIGDIIEVSFLRTSDNDQKTWYIKPTNPDGIDDGALKVNGYNRDDLLWKTKAGREKFRLLDDVLPEIENWICDDGAKIFDRILCGHNVNFDQKFLQSAWKKAKCDDTYPFSSYGMLIDTKGLALFFDWVSGQNNERYNLSACIKKFGLEQRKAHGAIDDVKMANDLLMHFAKKVK